MECGRQRSKVTTPFLHRCALRKFHVPDVRNKRDQITSDRSAKRARYQIAFCAFHSFLVEVQKNAGYITVTHA